MMASERAAMRFSNSAFGWGRPKGFFSLPFALCSAWRGAFLPVLAIPDLP